MIDGPLSFLLVFGLLGAAVLGAALFLVCLVGASRPRHRHRVLMLWKFGTVAGVVAFGAMSVLYLAVGRGPEMPRSLFAEWTGMAFFVGFGAGAMVYASLRFQASVALPR